MKPISIAGILLIVFGALALAYQGFTYTHRERVLDVGPIHATKDTQEHIPIPPILGGVAFVAGVVLLVSGGKRSAWEPDRCEDWVARIEPPQQSLRNGLTSASALLIWEVSECYARSQSVLACCFLPSRFMRRTRNWNAWKIAAL